MDDQGPPSDLPTPPPEDATPRPNPYELTTPVANEEQAAPAARASRAQVTALVVVVLLVLTGGGTALLLRASNSEQSVDKLIPGTVAAYVKFSLHPSVQQQQAVQGLLSRFPPSVRGQVGSKIDDMLESGTKDLGLSYKKDIKPWVGGQIALAVLAPGGSTSEVPSTIPNVIGIIPVKDASAAQTALSKVKAKVPKAPAFEVMGGVVYIGRTQGDIDTFRNAVTAGHTLADNATYTREHNRAGGDGLLFAYADLSKLAGVAPSLRGDILGGSALTGGTGVVAASLRATSEGLALNAHSSVPTSAKSPKGGTFKLLPQTPNDLLGSISFFDLGDLVGNLLKSLNGGLSVSPVSTKGQQIPGLSSVASALQEVEQALGLNLQKDLLPWLRGEFSIVVGPVTTPPIPDVGILIQPTDQAALSRTMSALRAHFGALASSFGGKVTTRSDGLTVRIPQGPAFVVRTGPDRVIIATEAYANRLLHASGASLAGDTVYKAAVDPSKPTTFQLFLRLDRIRTLVEGFLKLSSPSLSSTYETKYQPLLKPLQALGIQTTINGSEQEFRLILTIAKP
jgi:hypothetical protein